MKSLAGGIAVAVAASVALAHAGWQDTGAPTRGTSKISGIVVRDAGDEPASDATVTLFNASGTDPAQTTTTDPAGRFEFAALPAGRYELAATKPAFVRGVFGEVKAGQVVQPIAVADEQSLIGIRVPVFTGAVVTGTLWGTTGQPLPRVQVSAIRHRFLSGGRSGILSEASGTTDDRGRFRIFGLPPGDYAIVAMPTIRGQVPAPQARVLVPTFAPGTDRFDSATRIRLEAGDQRDGIDIRTTTVSTRVVNIVVRSADGSDLSGRTVRADVAPLDEPASTLAVRMLPRVDTAIEDLPVGRYRVSAQTFPPPTTATPTAAHLSGETVLDVSASATAAALEVTVIIARAARVLGTVEFRSASKRARPTPPQIPLWLIPVDAGANPALRWAARIDATGQFLFPGVPPGRYRFEARVTVLNLAASPWTLRGVALDNRVLADRVVTVGTADIRGLVVTMADDLATWSGSVTDKSVATPAPFIALVAIEPDTGGVRAAYCTRPAADGTFRFVNVVDGRYRVAVVDDVRQEDLNNRAALERFVAASTMTLTFAAGENKRQDIPARNGSPAYQPGQ